MKFLLDFNAKLQDNLFRAGLHSQSNDNGNSKFGLLENLIVKSTRFTYINIKNILERAQVVS